jgi:hypothetical protein
MAHSTSIVGNGTLSLNDSLMTTPILLEVNSLYKKRTDFIQRIKS